MNVENDFYSNFQDSCLQFEQVNSLTSSRGHPDHEF